MEPQAKKQRIIQFAQDKDTFLAVSEFVRDFFLRDRGNKDMNVLAGERIALNLAQSAFDALALEARVSANVEEERKNKGL